MFFFNCIVTHFYLCFTKIWKLFQNILTLINTIVVCKQRCDLSTYPPSINWPSDAYYTSNWKVLYQSGKLSFKWLAFHNVRSKSKSVFARKQLGNAKIKLAICLSDMSDRRSVPVYNKVLLVLVDYVPTVKDLTNIWD